jgi:hypothetical protein
MITGIEGDNLEKTRTHEGNTKEENDGYVVFK